MPWHNDDASRQHTAQHYGADWRKARLTCLRRARWRCQIRLTGCQGAATQVDHITPVHQGGTHEQANLRAACDYCHGRVTAQQGRGFRRAQRPADPSPQPRTAW